MEKYSLVQLRSQPGQENWSAGQLYLHLINDTAYYIQQIRICLASNDNFKEQASPEATIMLLNNAFPDILIKGNPANACIPQPDGIEQLKQGLLKTKEEMNRLALLLLATPFKGKTNHPGLHYLNAEEWLQFADMHFRHHLRQKNESVIF